MLHNRLHPFIASAVLCALAGAGATQAARIEQLAKDGVKTRYVETASPLLAPTTQICEPGASWMRVSLRELKLAPYDSLTLISSGGERYTFEGQQWNDKSSIATRALRGDCISFQPSFGSRASTFAVESYQSGTKELAETSVVVAGAGDICDTDTAAPTRCQGTSDVIVAINPTAVFTAGDNAYSNGTLTEYNSRYAPSWGRFKTLTNPTPGNHDYNTANASGYFDYFNGTGVQVGIAGDRSKGYYSWNVGDWHFIALNTMSGGTIAQAQLNWLSADLAANTKPCTAAYFHHPLVSRGNYSGYAQVKPIWDRLYAAHADLVLVGHDHNYQRYGLMDPNQAADANGIRQVLVGTGGRGFYGLSGSHPLLQASNANTHGVLKLTLTATGYTGNFVRSTRAGNGTFSDTFSGECHNAAAGGNSAPTANFGVATSGLTATFTDSSTDSDGTIASRSWNFGDGSTSTATNPSRTYAAAGTYTVSLTVTDNGGASNTTTKAVTVTAANVAPVANFGVATSGLTATFTDSSTDSDGTIASRSWNFGDGSTSTATNPSRTYAAAGTYSVSLTVTDNSGASHTTTKSVTVTSAPPPTCTGGTAYTNTFSGANGQTQWAPTGSPGYYQTTAARTHTICLSGPAGANFDIYLQKWDGSGWTTTVASSTGVAANESISYNGTAGYYAVKVINTSGTGAWTVTIATSAASGNNPPQANFNSSNAGPTVSFTDTSTDSDGSIVSRSWNFGDGTSSTATNPSRSYGAPGTYNVSLTVTDNAGATQTTTRAVVVCPGTVYTGTFSGASGQTQSQPGGSWYQTTLSGVHSVCLFGPAGTDFDIGLFRWNGSAWSKVASSEGPTSIESLSYTGTAGYYTVGVTNYAGTGSYTLTIQRP